MEFGKQGHFKDGLQIADVMRAAVDLGKGDPDVAAEPAAASLWAGLPVAGPHRQVIATLSGIASAVGSVPPRAAECDPDADEFANNHHTTLTALTALAADPSHRVRSSARPGGPLEKALGY